VRKPSNHQPNQEKNQYTKLIIDRKAEIYIGSEYGPTKVINQLTLANWMSKCTFRRNDILVLKGVGMKDQV